MEQNRSLKITDGICRVFSFKKTVKEMERWFRNVCHAIVKTEVASPDPTPTGWLGMIVIPALKGRGWGSPEQI